ncbi:TniQ family protein [Pseudorhodoferax soli]|uniref:TniQ protein n=1 Tax=Pseudorhodoferax soli TaxID=545864 RepID=A0A368XQA6_9BURK|nr:TniQ protein [Pseudorhodoferax soli]
MLPAPRPYPDEMLSSAVMRCGRHFCLSLKDLARELGVAYVGRLTHFSVQYLPALARWVGVSPHELAWRHTMLPYTTSSCSANSWSAQLELLVSSGSTENAKLRRSVNGAAHKRYCAACLSEDLLNYGESYWHRCHHLPGAWLCKRHCMYLCVTELRTDFVASSWRLLPHEVKGTPVLTAAPNPVVMRLSETSTRALLRSPGPGTHFAPDYFRVLAARRGWCKPGSIVGADWLAQALKDNLPTEYLRGCGLQRNLKMPRWMDASIVAARLLANAANRDSNGAIPLRLWLLEALLRVGTTQGDQQLRRSAPSQQEAGRVVLNVVSPMQASYSERVGNHGSD